MEKPRSEPARYRLVAMVGSGDGEAAAEMKARGIRDPETFFAELDREKDRLVGLDPMAVFSMLENLVRDQCFAVFGSAPLERFGHVYTTPRPAGGPVVYWQADYIWKLAKKEDA